MARVSTSTVSWTQGKHLSTLSVTYQRLICSKIASHVSLALQSSMSGFESMRLMTVHDILSSYRGPEHLPPPGPSECQEKRPANLVSFRASSEASFFLGRRSVNLFVIFFDSLPPMPQHEWDCSIGQSFWNDDGASFVFSSMYMCVYIYIWLLTDLPPTFWPNISKFSQFYSQKWPRKNGLQNVPKMHFLLPIILLRSRQKRQNILFQVEKVGSKLV